MLDSMQESLASEWKFMRLWDVIIKKTNVRKVYHVEASKYDIALLVAKDKELAKKVHNEVRCENEPSKMPTFVAKSLWYDEENWWWVSQFLLSVAESMFWEKAIS